MGTKFVKERTGAAPFAAPFHKRRFNKRDIFLLGLWMRNGPWRWVDTKGANTVTIKEQYTNDTLVIDDSRELGQLVHAPWTGSYWALRFQSLTTRRLDQKAPIHVSGRFPGAGPLMKILKPDRATHWDCEPISSVDIVDTVLIGHCVVAGNVRRSALALRSCRQTLLKPRRSRKTHHHRWAQTTLTTPGCGLLIARWTSTRKRWAGTIAWKRQSLQ